MALNYLLSPEFQIVNTAGKPATGGYLEVYISGSRERYYCASDFNGTLYPFQVPLDSLGSNVVLADDSHAYDVYAYNRYGSLLMSRYNVHPSSGGGMGGVITSTDGSVTVTPTQDGYDISVNDNKAAALKAAADTLYEDGSYYFRFMEGEGDQITVQNGTIILQDGWYHFSATVKLNWTGVNVNQTDQLKLYTELTYDIIDFDYSYNHADTVMLDGDIHIAPHSTQYISFGRTFTLAILGMHTGLSAELVDLDIHSITGQGFAGSYVPGEGIIIDSTNEISVDTTVIQEKLEAGDNIVIEGNVISATAEPQQQADWTESDTTSVTYIQNKPQNLVQDPDYVHTDNNYTDAEKSKLAGIEAGAQANVQADWTESDSSSDAYIQHKPDMSQYATQTDLAGKQDVLTAGQNITITNNVISADAAPQLQSNWAEDDNSSVQYIQNKPVEKSLVPGANISISEGPTEVTISATAAPQVQSDWTEADSSAVSYIQHKPTLAAVATSGSYNDLSNTPSIPSVGFIDL